MICTHDLQIRKANNFASSSHEQGIFFADAINMTDFKKYGAVQCNIFITSKYVGMYLLGRFGLAKTILNPFLFFDRELRLKLLKA